MALTNAGDEAPQNKGNLDSFVEAGKPYRFQPGKSGNPGGRPVKVREAEDVAVANLVKAMTKVAKHIDSEDDRVSLQASLQMIERVMGKAVQKVENKDTTDAKQIDEADLVNIATAGSSGTTET